MPVRSLVTHRAGRLTAILRITAGCAAVAACTTAPPRAEAIRITAAAYSVRDGSVPCNVTTKVASRCDGLANCRVVAASALCPMGDPAPAQAKVLTVDYTCAGRSMPQAQSAQGDTLELACPR